MKTFGFLASAFILLLIGGSVVKNTPSTDRSTTSAISPGYVEYSERALADASKRGKAVLFFWAPWCGTCSVLDDELREKSSKLPADVTILKVNYDTEKELTRKYQVITQHTLVQVDKNGNEVTKWIGGNVDAIREQLK